MTVAASERIEANSNLKALVQFATRRLIAAGVENARLDAELLLAFAAGLTREQLILNTMPADEVLRERFASLVELRAARMPLAYIVRRREFYSLELEVSPEVLIPRPETEILAGAAVAHLRDRQPGARVIDIGTGSGAIALAIAANVPHAQIVATDVLPEALMLASRNAARLHLASRIEFRRADCWDLTDTGSPRGRFDLVVANPPYIRDDEIALLPPEIRDFEPRLALSGGPDGLAYYRRIALDVGSHLAPGGVVMVEIGQGQATGVTAIFRAAGLNRITVLDDLAGIQRVVIARG